MNFNFQDKNVLVTGASRGIGAGIIDRFLNYGAKVVATGTSDESVNKIKQNTNPNLYALTLNLNSKDSIKNLFTHLSDKELMPHILINNGGITQDNLILRMSDEEWDSVINTNLSGTFYMIKNAVKQMIKYKFGRIITISSVIGHTGNPGQVNYSASKAGLIGLTKSLAREVGSRNITVNAISPGFIQTDMTNKLDDNQIENLLKSIPLKRLGTIDDVVSSTLFLSSDLASYITGETIHVNGGMFMS
ncbi:MAG: 3-oxoacyl-[acyl-carrier-protein] reductase [Gammaproteobacteria bacterium]|jgi:3-oxoacyl-[acyl-carrier protein] reductase